MSAGVVWVSSGFVGGVTIIAGFSDGLGIVPSRYPDIPLRSAAIPIRPFQATQFVPSNLSVSGNIGGVVLDILVWVVIVLNQIYVVF